MPKARRLVDLAPWWLATHETLAQALARDGDFQGAAAAYEQGALQAPEGPQRQRLLAAAAKAREDGQRRRRNEGM